MCNFGPLLSCEYRKFLLLQKRYWLFIAIPIVLTFIANGMIFFSFIIMFYTSLTLVESAEEKCGGQFFLGALPVSRKTIVSCKYMIAILNLVGISFILVLVNLISSLTLNRGEPFLSPFFLFGVILLIGLLYILVSLPIAICFGYTKGRLVNLILYMLLLIGSNQIWEIVKGSNILAVLTDKLWMVVVFTVAAAVFSYLIAQQNYQKKQYLN